MSTDSSNFNPNPNPNPNTNTNSIKEESTNRSFFDSFGGIGSGNDSYNRQTPFSVSKATVPLAMATVQSAQTVLQALAHAIKQLPNHNNDSADEGILYTVLNTITDLMSSFKSPSGIVKVGFTLMRCQLQDGYQGKNISIKGTYNCNVFDVTIVMSTNCYVLYYNIKVVMVIL
jgi:hypothetical protein